MEWPNYMFTNEILIEVEASFGKSQAWREKGEKWYDDCVGTKKKKKEMAHPSCARGQYLRDGKGLFYMTGYYKRRKKKD